MWSMFEEKCSRPIFKPKHQTSLILYYLQVLKTTEYLKLAQNILKPNI